MIILIDPFQEKDAGEQLAVPATLEKQVARWATVQFSKYHFGYILRQEFIAKMFSIHIYRFIIQSSIILHPYNVIPNFVLQFMLLGSLPCQLKGLGKILLRESSYNMFHVPAGLYEALFEQGEYESFHIEFHHNYTRELSVMHPDMSKLMERLKEATFAGQPLPPAVINKEIKTVISDLRSYTKEGGALSLSMNSDIYKLLSLYEEHITNTDNRNYVVLPGTEQTLSEIRQYIVMDPDIHECSVDNLAKKFGINSNTLKINFKNEFKITLHQFVLDQVMQKARLMVLEDRLSISTIAIQLGYFDKSNFAKAFKRYFNCLPTEMRKRQE